MSRSKFPPHYGVFFTKLAPSSFFFFYPAKCVHDGFFGCTSLKFAFKIYLSWLILITELFFSILAVYSSLFFFHPAKRVHEGFLWYFSLNFAFQIYSSWSIFPPHTELFFSIFGVSSSLLFFFNTLLNVFRWALYDAFQ